AATRACATAPGPAARASPRPASPTPASAASSRRISPRRTPMNTDKQRRGRGATPSSSPRRLPSSCSFCLLLYLCSSVFLCGYSSSPARGAEGLRVPDGFEVTEYAGADLANDIYCLTVGPKGQVVVSGRGYVRLLVEGKGGRAERALDFAGAPKDGAMGL